MLNRLIVDFDTCGEVAKPVGKLCVGAHERFNAAQYIIVEAVLAAEQSTERLRNPAAHRERPTRILRSLGDLLRLRHDCRGKHRARRVANLSDCRQLRPPLEPPNFLCLRTDALHQLGNADFSNFGFDHGSEARRRR